jgi:glycosyltransferase involved in cell wall biosynthesis
VRVVFCVPSLNGPTEPLIAAMEQSLPLVRGAGWEAKFVQEINNPYISAARATMLRKALDGSADVVVFLDYDLSWDAGDLLKLIETPGEVVAGLYRFKKDEEEYMGAWDTDPTGRPRLRDDGCIIASRVSAGFLKITRAGVERFMRAYPALCYGSPINPSVDLFNHGAHEGVWWGEDYAFSRRWLACGGELAVIPDLNLNHHAPAQAYPGNLHQFLMRQPGGINDPARTAP